MMYDVKKIIKFLQPYIKKTNCTRALLISLVLIILSSILYIPIPQLLGQTTNLLNTSNLQGNLNDIIFCLGALLVLYIIKYLITVCSKTRLSKIERIVVTKVRMDMVEKYLDLPSTEIEEDAKGNVMGRFDEANQLSQMFSSGFIGTFLNFLEFVFSISMIFLLNINIFILLAAILPVYYFSIKRISSKISGATIALFNTSNIVTGKIFECINSVEAIKLLNAQKFIIDGIKKKNSQLINTAYKQSRIINIFTENVQLIYNIINIIIIAACTVLMYWNNMNFSQYIILTGYIIKTLSFVLGVSSLDIIVKPVSTAVERISEFLSLNGESQQGKISIKKCEDIKLVNVAFKYPSSKANVLNELNLHISTGESLLIKGDIGSGKSTLIKLIMGMYPLQNGDILINGISIKNIDRHSLRKQIGMVSQDVVLFNGSILENITLGRSEITRKRVKNMIHSLNLDCFFDKFEKGLDTIISKNSLGVSGGQAKIIALLRILIIKKDVIILDEATANLDREYVQKIVDIFKNYHIGRILIVITHSDDWDYIENTFLL